MSVKRINQILIATLIYVSFLKVLWEKFINSVDLIHALIIENTP